MLRRQPITVARGRPLWLLLALALVALGLWSGAPCPDDHPARASAAAVSFAVHADPGPRQPSSAADDCQARPARSIVSAPTTVAASPAVRAQGRISPDTPPRPAEPLPAGIALSAIGVSRT